MVFFLTRYMNVQNNNIFQMCRRLNILMNEFNALCAKKELQSILKFITLKALLLIEFYTVYAHSSFTN